MAAFLRGLADIFSAIPPFKKSTTVRRAKESSLQSVTLHTGDMQYTSTGQMLANPPSELQSKAVLATTQPAIEDGVMQFPVEDLEANKPVLNMRGGLEHDHHGTEICHDVCGCFICCDFMDYCCTAIDDIICCE